MPHEKSDDQEHNQLKFLDYFGGLRSSPFKQQENSQLMSVRTNKMSPLEDSGREISLFQDLPGSGADLAGLIEPKCTPVVFRILFRTTPLACQRLKHREKRPALSATLFHFRGFQEQLGNALRAAADLLISSDQGIGNLFRGLFRLIIIHANHPLPLLLAIFL